MVDVLCKGRGGGEEGSQHTWSCFFIASIKKELKAISLKNLHLCYTYNTGPYADQHHPYRLVS